MYPSLGNVPLSTVVTKTTSRRITSNYLSQ
uniref:Uncharacterized protein n=1 Tax=viral metagenome TaxID=1070528 RepID=A0A6C0D134_9ZZZZ